MFNHSAVPVNVAFPSGVCSEKLIAYTLIQEEIYLDLLFQTNRRNAPIIHPAIVH